MGRRGTRCGVIIFSRGRGLSTLKAAADEPHLERYRSARLAASQHTTIFARAIRLHLGRARAMRTTQAKSPPER